VILLQTVAKQRCIKLCAFFSGPLCICVAVYAENPTSSMWNYIKSVQLCTAPATLTNSELAMGLVPKAENDWCNVERPQVAMHRNCHIFQLSCINYRVRLSRRHCGIGILYAVITLTSTLIVSN